MTGNEGQSSGRDGQSSEHQESAAQASLGGIPPSFGVSSPPPPVAPEALPPEPTAPEPAAHLESDPAPSPDAGAPPSPILPELQDTSSVGWYPSQPAGPPSAGPFAAPATPARRGISGIAGINAFARAARPESGQPSAWRNRRSTLANVLLFGLGPLVLVGVVVAAFLLVSPGKGTAASSLGFQAGPGATAQPSMTSAPAAPPSSAAPAKHHIRPTTATPTPGSAGGSAGTWAC